MGTEKRERQKANRQLKLQQLEQERTKQHRKRKVLRIVLGVIGAVALVIIASKLFGGDETPGTDLGAAVTFTTEAPTTLATLATQDSVSVATVVEPTTTVATVAPLPTVTVVPPEAQAAGNLPCPADDGSEGRVVNFPTVDPPTCIDRAKAYTAVFETTAGDFTVELDAKRAPVTVNSFVYLARYHYFDNTLCHRVVPGFVFQCGDPTGTGSGGPGYQFDDELPAPGEYKLGSLVMANSGANTNGSQFFVVTGDKGVALPPSYALFGQVTDGLDSTVSDIDALGVGDRQPSTEPVYITSVTITES